MFAPTCIEKSAGLCFVLRMTACISVSGSGEDAKCAAIVDKQCTNIVRLELHCTVHPS